MSWGGLILPHRRFRQWPPEAGQTKYLTGTYRRGRLARHSAARQDADSAREVIMMKWLSFSTEWDIALDDRSDEA